MVSSMLDVCMLFYMEFNTVIVYILNSIRAYQHANACIMCPRNSCEEWWCRWCDTYRLYSASMVSHVPDEKSYNQAGCTHLNVILLLQLCSPHGVIASHAWISTQFVRLLEYLKFLSVLSAKIRAPLHHNKEHSLAFTTTKTVFRDG
jgi:hypothetical protein